MARVGDLTKSGILYEANLDEWEARFNAMLSYRRTTDICWRTYSGESVYTIYAVMSTVARHILLRVPTESQADVMQLKHWLRRVARPFPLMDLAPEIRLMIYSQFWNTTASIQVEKGNVKMKGRELLQISSAVRAEALPKYYQGTPCYMEYAGGTGDTTTSITKFVLGIGAANLKHLRTFVLSLTLEDDAIGDFDYYGENEECIHLEKLKRRPLAMSPCLNR